MNAPSSSVSAINAADGDFDEAAERAAFSEAVMEWRKGGGRVKVEREGDFPDSSAERKASMQNGDGGMWHNPFGLAVEESDLLSSSSSSSAKSAKAFPAVSSSGGYLQQGGMLDEAAEREEFRRAVEEWRGGKACSKDSTSPRGGGGGEGMTAGVGRSLADKLSRELEAEQALISQNLQRQREEATRKLEAANRGLEEARRSRQMQAEAPTASASKEDDDNEDELAAPASRRSLSTNPSQNLDAFTPPLSPNLSDDEADGKDEGKDNGHRAQSKCVLSLVETSMGSDFGEDKGGYLVEEEDSDDD